MHLTTWSQAWTCPFRDHSAAPAHYLLSPELQAVPRDLSRPWEDPLPDPGERQLAQGLRGANLAPQEVPEWKQRALGKAPTLGMKDARPIKEQRESLPIFRLRDQLIQAVHDHQVLVVIGETGACHRHCAGGLTLYLTLVVVNAVWECSKLETLRDALAACPCLTAIRKFRCLSSVSELIAEAAASFLPEVNTWVFLMRLRADWVLLGCREREDDAGAAVPGRGGLHFEGQDRHHAAAASGGHERVEACRGGSGLPCRRGGKPPHSTSIHSCI